MQDLYGKRLCPTLNILRVIRVSREMLYPEWVHVGVVACGDRQPETCVAVKAIMSTTSAHVFVHIFTEDDLKPSFIEEVSLFWFHPEFNHRCKFFQIHT